MKKLISRIFVGAICTTFAVLLFLAAPEAAQAKTTYKVTTYTADIGGGATDDDIYINIKGDLDETGFIKLDNKLKDDFEKGNTDVFYISGDDVGEIDEAEMRNTGNDSWAVEDVTVTKNKVKYKFACNVKLSADTSEGVKTKSCPFVSRYPKK